MRAFNKQSFQFVGNGIARCEEYAQLRPELHCLVCKITPAEDISSEIDIGKEYVYLLSGTQKCERLTDGAG